MNKSQLITAAAQRAGISQKDAQRLLDAVQDIIVETLARGDKLQITGLGTLEVRQREARTGRDIHTGKAVTIPAAKTAVFKPSKLLKDTVNK